MRATLRFALGAAAWLAAVLASWAVAMSGWALDDPWRLFWMGAGAMLAGWVVPAWWAAERGLSAVARGLRFGDGWLDSHAGWVDAGSAMAGRASEQWMVAAARHGYGSRDVPPWVDRTVVWMAGFSGPLVTEELSDHGHAAREQARRELQRWHRRVQWLRGILALAVCGPGLLLPMLWWLPSVLGRS